MFHVDNNIYNLTPKDFIGYSTRTLRLLNIQDKPLSDDVNIRNNYTVTEKADGVRKLLIINETGTIYMMDTEMRIQYTGMHTTIKDIFNSVLDGEHIKYDKKNKYINMFAAFDIYMLNNEDKRVEVFIGTNKDGKKMGRLPVLEKVVKSINMKPGKNISEKSFTIICKKFYTDEGKDIFANCNMILQKETDGLYDYNIDGLIFTPSNESIPVSNHRITWDLSFKWKPPQFNTIDFLVKIHKESGKDGGKMKMSAEKGAYLTLHLYVGFSGGYIDPLNDLLNYNSKSYRNEYNIKKIEREKKKYKPALFLPTNPYDDKAYVCNLPLTFGNTGELQLFTEENELITDNTIVEFSYDKNETVANFQWKPLRIRHDKTQQLREFNNNFGNNYDTANSNWNSIHNPITNKMISSGINIPETIDDDVYYNRKSNETSTRGLRDFHNQVVKRILIDTVSKKDDTLMDFAVGKGGDFPKWINSHLSFVYGVDVMRDNIENKKDGACARFLNYALRERNLPNCLFATGDSGKNIRSGDALEDDKYRMINDVVFGKGSRDKMKMGNHLFENYGKGEKGFQITSVQFAIHYFFKNKITLENFISNVVQCTKINGYFIGTSYDGKAVFNMLRNIQKGESTVLKDKNNKVMWEITKQYDREEFNNDGSCLSYPIDVYQESINQTITEYLVNYDYFNELMNIYGFKLVSSDEIKNMGLKNSSGLFSELYQDIEDNYNTTDKYKNTRLGETLNMSDNEKTISFLNRYFIYEKIREYNGEINIIGTSDEISEDVSQEISKENDDYLMDYETNENIVAPGTPEFPVKFLPRSPSESPPNKSIVEEGFPGTPLGTPPQEQIKRALEEKKAKETAIKEETKPKKRGRPKK